MFVNCQLCGWVIRIEPSRMTTVLVRCESLLIGSICLGSHGFAHPVKVDVRLVSFPCPAFEMTWPQNYSPLHNVALSTASRRRRGWAFWFRYRPGCLRQLPQRLLQLGQPVDFRYGMLQRLHRSCDVLEEMFVTLDQAEKSVST